MNSLTAFMACAWFAGAGIASAREPAPTTVADGPIESLKPGDYLWAPDIAPSGPVTVIISLKTQRAYTYRNGVPIGVSTVSTGKRGHATPTGIFMILQKQIEHRSNLYSDAPMPFMQRLTWAASPCTLATCRVIPLRTAASAYREILPKSSTRSPRSA